jgi:hypothetical protein
MNMKVAVETGTTGLWYGRFIDLMGTHARAQTLEQLREELGVEVTYHNMWLKRHSEPTINISGLNIEVAELVEDVELLGESGGSVACFKYDVKPVDEQIIEKSLRYMDYNRQDLLELIKGLSEEELSYTPHGKKRNIIQILNHICNAEEWYISRLGSEADIIFVQNLGMPVDNSDELPINQRMNIVRKASKKTLNEILIKKDGFFTRSEFTQFPNEQWTARKVLRRFLEHEREHIYNIRWYLGMKIRAFP